MDGQETGPLEPEAKVLNIETMADEECEESAKMSGHTNWTQIKIKTLF